MMNTQIENSLCPPPANLKALCASALSPAHHIAIPAPPQVTSINLSQTDTIHDAIEEEHLGQSSMYKKAISRRERGKNLTRHRDKQDHRDFDNE